MLDMEDNTHRNKNAVRAALGMIRTLSKVDKIKESELEKLKPEAETYKNSKEYRDLLEDIRKRDDEDDSRNDYDPKGYDAYEKAVRSLLYSHFELVERSNWKSTRVCHSCDQDQP